MNTTERKKTIVKGLSDVEQDLLIERARTAELQTKLGERDNRIVELSYALRTKENDMKKLRESLSISCDNIKALSAELLTLCSEIPIDGNETRRRALALAEITCRLAPSVKLAN